MTIPEATDGVNADDELKDGVQTEVTVPGGNAAGDTLTPLLLNQTAQPTPLNTH